MPLRIRLRTSRSDADEASAGLSAVIGPAAVRNTARYLRVGDGHATTLIVTGYPAEVGPAWLDPLLTWPGRLDLAVYIDPLAPQAAAARLRRQRARLESNRRTDAEKGRLADPLTDAAAGDAADLADRIARGEHGRDTDVLRRADHTAAALAALGAQTAVLDGGRAAAVLTCATDPYTPADVTWSRARPGTVITGSGD